MAFEFIFTSDEIREKMLDYISFNYYQNEINWIYGVYNKEDGLFITQTGRHIIGVDGIEDYYYIMIMDKGDISTISTHQDFFSDKERSFCVDDKYISISNTIKEGITYYDRERFEFCRSYRRKGVDINKRNDDMQREMESRKKPRTVMILP